MTKSIFNPCLFVKVFLHVNTFFFSLTSDNAKTNILIFLPTSKSKQAKSVETFEFLNLSATCKEMFFFINQVNIYVSLISSKYSTFNFSSWWFVYLSMKFQINFFDDYFQIIFKSKKKKSLILKFI